ncbi:MAG: peptidylprolyl isomerase [Methanobacteriota archaeon]
MKKIVLMLTALVLVCGCLDGGSQTGGETLDDRLTTLIKRTTTTTVISEETEIVGEETMGEKYAVIETDKGTIKAKLYTEKAPISTKNFIELAERGFYDGLVFHRVVPNFVIQTGDPTATGTGGSEKTIPLEIHPDLKHELGAFGMARTSDPNSATSQFYIVIGDAGFLDGNYAVFGQTLEGMEVAQKIAQGDKMTNVLIVDSL